jgi:hypothetical protein
MAGHGLLFGQGSSWATEPGVEPGGTAEVLSAVPAYIEDPVLHQGGEFSNLTAEALPLALIAGARRAAEDAQAIERAAAQLALERGVTARQPAAVGIGERAANDRYRKAPVTED